MRCDLPHNPVHFNPLVRSHTSVFGPLIWKIRAFQASDSEGVSRVPCFVPVGSTEQSSSSEAGLTDYASSHPLGHWCKAGDPLPQVLLGVVV